MDEFKSDEEFNSRLEFDCLTKSHQSRNSSLLNYLFRLLFDQIHKDNRNEVLSILNHIQIEKNQSHIFLSLFREDEIFEILFYCLNFRFPEIFKKMCEIIYSMLSQTRLFDHFLFHPVIIEFFASFVQQENHIQDDHLPKLILLLSKFNLKDSIIFWDCMMSFSECKKHFESISQYIYYQIENLVDIETLNYEQLFNILDNILTSDNPINFGTVTMTIRKSFDIHHEAFIQKYATFDFFNFIMATLQTIHLHSVQRECLLLLNSFTLIFSENQEVQFPCLIDLLFLSSLIKNQATCYLGLKYFHGIVSHFPSLLSDTNLQNESTPLYLLILEIAESDTAFKSRNESFLIIMNGINAEIFTHDFLKEHYNRIIDFFFEFVENNASVAHFLLSMIIKLCTFLIDSGIDAESIQCIFNEKDADQILSRINHNSTNNLDDDIQALFSVINYNE